MARLCLLALVAPVMAIMVACGGGSSHPTPSPLPTSTAGPTALPPPHIVPAAEASTPQPSPPAPLAIVNGTLIDGTGASPVREAYVLVRNGRIERVQPGGSSIEVPDGYRVIDAGGGTIMPGLIDGHVHITQSVVSYNPTTLSTSVYEDALEPFVRAGFTTLRDVGTATVIFSSIKFLADRLDREGRAPHIVWAGPIITTKGGYPLPVPRYAASGQAIGSADEGVALVDQLADAGAGIIKLGLEKGYYRDEGWPLLTLDEVRAVTQRAHAQGMLVTAHVTSLDEVRLAVDGGVDNLAHTPLEPIPDEMLQEMLRRGMGMVTTATIWDPDAAANAAANAKRYADTGGVVSIGTDFGCCGQVAGIDSYLREMQYLFQAGMTPMQLIVAATRGGAQVANSGDQTGTIAPGKAADIIIVDGDPLADLNALRNVRAVIADGRVVFERAAASASTEANGPVAFRVCSRDDAWTRPSEEQMQTTAWRDPRYRDLSPQIRYQYRQDGFYRYNGSASLSGPWVLLSGLGQYPPNNTGECGSDQDRDRAVIGDITEIWMLGYEPVSLERSASSFVLSVTPLGAGFRAVQFGSRGSYDLPVQIVDTSGQPLECLGPDSPGGVCP